MAMDPRLIGRRIKTKRVMAGLSQADLGKIVGLSARCIYDLERGETRTSLTVAMKLIVILGLEPAEVIDLDDVTLHAQTVIQSKTQAKATRRAKPRAS